MASDNLRSIADAGAVAEGINLLLVGVTVAQAIGQVDQINAPARPDWIAERFARINGAIAFLRARAVLVTPVNREHHVRKYWVSGYRHRLLAEDVIALAQSMGWENAA